MKMIKFPSIEQYRSIVKHVKDNTAYVGKDEEGNAIFNYDKEYPQIRFYGTPKGHGTNAGVSFDFKTGELWAQSRENIITIQKDNAGFAAFVEKNKEDFIKMFHKIKETHDYFFRNFELNEPTYPIVTIFGEWAGPGIQKGVGISQIDKKSFFIFDIKITNEDQTHHWVNIDFEEYTNNAFEPVLRNFIDDVYLMTDMAFYDISIDFNKPEEIQELLIKLTDEVEHNCPIAEYFGLKNTIGEGIVWRTWFNGDMIRFKVKGEKHSSSKVKTPVEIDVEKMNSVNEFVDYCVTENRLNQGIEQVFTCNNLRPDIKNTGDFIKWISKDVLKEETDTLVKSDLIWKDVSGVIAKKASQWFKEYLDSNL